ncbi:MAG: hypothetical protein IPL65_08705 [Lewinellaceae bacterium]|nr:hypothetical protein [Lewinellaceae bacterium]
MQQSKLLGLLRQFSTRQWRRFGDFLASPYFNQREDVQQLYQYLSPHHPALEHPALEKSILFQRWKGSELGNEKALAYLMSRLQTLAEEFMSFEYLSADPVQKAIFALQALPEKVNNRYFNQQLEKAKQLLEQSELRDANYYRQAFELAQLEHLAAADPFRHQYSPSLQALSQRLDRFFILHKLRLLCDMANQKKYLNVQYEALFEKVVASELEGSEWLEEPVFAMYYYAWRTTVEDREEDFQRCLALLNQHAAVLTVPEQKALYNNALNFCTRRINRDNDLSYYEVYLDINEHLLTRALLLEDGYLPPWRFMNMVNAGIKTGRWEWTQTFIVQGSQKLSPEHTENFSHYALALWHYAQKQLTEAQRQLVTVEFNDVLLSLTARSLQIKIYYEAEETELLFSALEAARIYLLRSTKIEPRLRLQMQNFVDQTRRLARLYPPDPEKLGQMLKKLPGPAELMHRDWLLEQIRKHL